MQPVTYTAWNGEEYPWPPPRGWSRRVDGRYWPDDTTPPTPAAPTAPASVVPPPPPDRKPGLVRSALGAVWSDRGWKGRSVTVVAGLVLVGVAIAEPSDPEVAVEDATAPTTTLSELPPPTTTSSTTPVADPTTTTPPIDPDGLLDGLEVVERHAPGTPYERDDYQPGGWADADGDCLSTRHEILEARSLDPVTYSDNGCRVVSGRWIDAYTGVPYTLADDVSIDHMIPLAEAHRAGAWRWDDATRVAFTNDLDDPTALLIVAPDVNQAKADRAPDAWRPDDPALWCGYATDWADRKRRWGLSVDEPERAALAEMLGTCTEASVDGPDTPPPSIVTTSTTTTTVSSTTVATVAGAGQLEIATCARRDEIVELVNTGGSALSLSGWRLHDEGDKHSFRLGGITLEAGEGVRILTGEEIEPAEGDIVWKRQNVWNNDGDTAFVVDGDGTVLAERRCS